MERKRIGEIGIAVAIVVALLVVIFLLFRRETSAPIPEKQVAPSLPAAISPEKKPITIDPARVPQPQEVSATTAARTFVERIGSYSSQSDYKNVDDVLSMVTADLSKELVRQANVARAEEPVSEGYYGISTAYLGAKTLEESEDQITLLVQTQREESFGSPKTSEVRYQSVEITLTKEENTWKVDAYTWQE